MVVRDITEGRLSPIELYSIDEALFSAKELNIPLGIYSGKQRFLGEFLNEFRSNSVVNTYQGVCNLLKDFYRHGEALEKELVGKAISIVKDICFSKLVI